MTETTDPTTDAPAPAAGVTLSRMRIAFELEDGVVDVVTVRSRSRVAWDMTRGTRRWPKTDEAPMLWVDFLCWHALVQEGRFEGKFEDFQAQCIATELQEAAPDPTPQDEPAI